MDEHHAPTATRPDEDRVPPTRDCSRCDGQQHLVASEHGMGKYRCDTCEMIVGFDLGNTEPEFLIERGVPHRYTKDRFGMRLLPQERRLGARAPEPDQLSEPTDA